MDIITAHWGEMWQAYLLTIQISVYSFALALVWGGILATFRISPLAPLRTVGFLYVQIVQSIPLLVWLVLVTFALPEAGVKFSFEWSVIIGISVYYACYVCETVRSGFLSIPDGHLEAARALGLTFPQTLRFIVLPEAFRSMIQPLGTLFMGVVLSSALGAAVGVTELTGITEQLQTNFAQPIQTFGAAVIGYLILTLGIGYITGLVERKVRIKA